MAKGTVEGHGLPQPERLEKRRDRDPRRALGLFYGAQFAHLGVVTAFLPLWLEARGFSALEIGALVALPSAFKLATPWLWGRWADQSGRRKELLLLALALAATGLGSLAVSRATGLLVAGLALYGFARSAVLPYAEVTALEQADRRGFSYGTIRLWGSLTFIAGSFGYGAVAARLSEDTMPLVAAGCLGLGLLVALGLPRPLEEEPNPGGAPPSGAAPRRLAPFFVACALMQTSHGAYYAFYSIRLERLGFGELAIGGMWAFAVLCEVLLFTRLDRWVDRWGSARVMEWSLAVATIRWLLIATTALTPLLLLGQAMHALTYGAFHVASIRVVHRAYRHARARGQSLFSGLTYGLGSVVGGLVAGALAEPIGLGPLFVLSALMAAAGWALLRFSAAERLAD